MANYVCVSKYVVLPLLENPDASKILTAWTKCAIRAIHFTAIGYCQPVYIIIDPRRCWPSQISAEYIEKWKIFM